MSIKSMTKYCSLAVLVALLVFAALGPAKWQVRSGLGWQFDHIAGYFAFTLFFWIAWPRPFVVGGVLMAAAILLELLQALTPDRSCDLHAALYGAGGALAAALVGDVLSRAMIWLNRENALVLAPAWRLVEYDSRARAVRLRSRSLSDGLPER